LIPGLVNRPQALVNARYRSGGQRLDCGYPVLNSSLFFDDFTQVQPERAANEFLFFERSAAAFRK